MGPGGPGGLHQIAQAVRSGQYTRPKTVLGFFWGVLAIAISGAVAAVWVLASNSSLHSLIAPILIFIGGLVVVVLLAVFVAMIKDPTMLMLGEMTGREYVAYRALTMGDSTTGERVEQIIDSLPGRSIMLTEATKLPESGREDGE